MVRRGQRVSSAIASFILISLASAPAFSQARRSNRPRAAFILERNVRAQLGFLASDALQGRGSGTGYERIAAEYIGSQFRQFGLEPGGDADETGTKAFVQKVQLQTVKFTEAPTLTVRSTGETKTLQYSRDFSVASLRSPGLKGPLNAIEPDGAPTKGTVLLIKNSGALDGQKRQEITRKARMAQATAVMLLETDASRSARTTGEVRLPTLPSNIQGDTSTGAAFAIISLSKEAFDQLLTIADGAQVEFGGKTETSEAGTTWNAIGVLPGSDPNASQDAIVLSAHLDHLGAGGTGADPIFNGADDDASGCVAVLELARVLASGKRPRRTIYFACFGSEERGGYGARYFISHSSVPIERIIANLQFEMLGRPDAKVAPNTLWLTGYDRSNLGQTLAKRGAHLVADPHPQQNFFQRSDNFTLALRGVVAHTVSSFGLHTDYHRPSDDLGKIDFPFMTRSINSMVIPIRWLANSNYRPQWLPGKSPKAS